MSNCGQACPYNTLNGCKVKEYNAICHLSNMASVQTANPKTNADRIRAMSDEELAEAFYNLVDNIQTGTMNDLSDLYCDGKNGCIDKDANITCTPQMEKACVLRWLRSPAKSC